MDIERAAVERADAAEDTELPLLMEFVNTSDIEGGVDEIGTPELLSSWLATQAGEEAFGPMLVDRDTHRRAIDIREGLRALGRSNNGEPGDAERVAALNRASESLRVSISLAPDAWDLAPAGRGADAVLGRILSILVKAMADGRWSRVKACRNDTCQFLFVDRSRNRSATWCSMAICGSRMKARSYRARRRGEAETSRGASAAR
jgi:predicted RNA-binding Zn ribbon-like protein